MPNEKEERRKPGFLMFRNKFGQVTVAYEKRGANIFVGFSFCNPIDFNHPRKYRLFRGQSIALRRLKNPKQWVMIPDNSINYAKDNVHWMFRRYVLEFMSDILETTGPRSYRGKRKNNKFLNWFTPFLSLEFEKHDNKSWKLKSGYEIIV